MVSGVTPTALLFALLCAACTTTSISPSLAVRPSADSPSVDVSTRSAIFERECGSDVHDNLDKHLLTDATVVGPLKLVFLSDYADATAQIFGARGDRFLALKVLAVVDPGRSVTLTVPTSLRDRLGLLYDPSAWKTTGRYRVAEGDPGVRFLSCDIERATQFNGGLIAAGPGCYALNVRVDDGPTHSIRFPLGERC